MRWYERPDVLNYIVQCYAGVDVVDRHQIRQFIWETADGDVVIGNPRAFADHVSERFQLALAPTAWSGVHEALRAMGEVAKAYSPRTQKRGGKFKNQQPEVRVIRKGGARG